MSRFIGKGASWVARAFALAAFVVLTVVAASPAAAAAQNVLRATLSNGLRVVIVRNTLAPVVATSVNYLVGSDESPKGFPGTAHALEHMMFRGSPGLSVDQLANIGSIMGANFNANTGESVTQYLYTVPSEDLDVALHIEAIRMQAITCSQADWEKERGAIEQEVAGDISSPQYKFYQKMRAALFAGSPYEHTPLGTPSSFDKTKASSLKAFHDTWYAPNNAILVVAGNVDLEVTLAKIKQLFGAIAPKKLPGRPKMTFKPVQPTSIAIDSDDPYALLYVALRMPGLDSPDYPALEILADVLASSRFDLYALVPQGKALDTGFQLDSFSKAGLAYAVAAFPEGQDPKPLEKEIRAILAKAARDGVPAELVEAAKLKERRSAEEAKTSIADLASNWADAIALYGVSSPDEQLKRIEKVTPADVARVARKYLDLHHAITTVLLPQHSGGAVASHGDSRGRETITLGEAKPTELPDWAKTALNRFEVPVSTLNPVVSKLPNGLTVIVQPENVSDTVAVRGFIRTMPAMEEAPGKDGVSALLDWLMSYGTEHLDRIAYQKALDEIGAREKAGTVFSIQVLPRDFDRGVELLADNELHPALPEAALNVLKPQIAQLVDSRNNSPDYLVQRSLSTALYPPGDPVLREATAQTIAALTREDVVAYYKKAFRPDLAAIVVIGNIAPEQARAGIEKYFGGWTAEGPKPDVDPPLAAPNHAASIAVPDASRVQDNVVLAHNIPISRDNPAYYALQLGNAVLGGGFYSSRLSTDLRKNAGLVYSVDADLSVGRTRGGYSVEYACDPANVSKAAAIVAQDIKAMQTVPVAADELLRVKALKLRQISLSEASLDGIAQGFLGRFNLALPLDEPTRAAQRIIELTPADIQGAFAKWVRPDDLVRITQGPEPK